MSDLSAFPITQKWAPQNPDILQLYSFPTPNGVKISIALEEMGLDYEPHLVTLSDADVKSPEFLSLNPNNKIPAIIDPNGPDGTPIGLFESGAILIYLAEKTGKLIGANAADKAKVIQWLMFQMGGVGPMLGQMGFFVKFAGAEIEDPRPRERYVNESRRLMGVLNQRLEGREFIMGDEYTIADIASWPWIKAATGFYEATEALGMDEFPNVLNWAAACAARPASEKAANIPARG